MAGDEKRLEIVRRSFDAFNRQDFDTAVTYAHPEIEYVRVGGLGSIFGLEAYRAWMEPDALEDVMVTLLHLEANGEHVFVRGQTQARGVGSGVEVDITMFAVFTFGGDDLVTRIQMFLAQEEAEARRAAGLAT